MSDAERSEKYAIMCLRVVLEVWKYDPDQASADARDALNITDQTEADFTDPNDFYRIINSDEAKIATKLIHRMLAEGVFEGTWTKPGIDGARVSSRVRRNLREIQGSTSSRSDEIRYLLAQVDAGNEMPLGTFARLAEDVGFEP